MFSVFSYFLYRKIGKNLIKKDLKEIQKNDCLSFREDEIGKEKFFNRTYFVKRDRDANMNMFEYARNEPKKILNNNPNFDGEESKKY